MCVCVCVCVCVCIFDGLSNLSGRLIWSVVILFIFMCERFYECRALFYNLQLRLARHSWKGMAYGFYSSFIKSWKNYIQIHWKKEKRIIHLGLIVYFYGYRKKKKMLTLVFPWLWIHKRMKPIFSIEIEIQISVGKLFCFWF